MCLVGVFVVWSPAFNIMRYKLHDKDILAYERTTRPQPSTHHANLLVRRTGIHAELVPYTAQAKITLLLLAVPLFINNIRN